MPFFILLTVLGILVSCGRDDTTVPILYEKPEGRFGDTTDAPSTSNYDADAIVEKENQDNAANTEENNETDIPEAEDDAYYSPHAPDPSASIPLPGPTTAPTPVPTPLPGELRTDVGFALVPKNGKHEWKFDWNRVISDSIEKYSPNLLNDTYVPLEEIKELCPKYHRASRIQKKSFLGVIFCIYCTF